MLGRIRARLTATAKLRFRYMRPETGSAGWLIKKEMEYGGLVTDVPRRRVSPLDPRSPAQLAYGGMTGGDRMYDNGYAEHYERHLRPFMGRSALTVAEFGILKGTGLAIWCDLFPDADVLGLDIDPEHFNNNRAWLESRGAFARNRPQVHEFDQLADDAARVGNLLRGRKLDIVIDDGLHSADAILRTWESVKPHLSPTFVYFIEDYDDVFGKHGHAFEGYDTVTAGIMNIVLPRNPTRTAHA